MRPAVKLETIYQAVHDVADGAAEIATMAAPEGVHVLQYPGKPAGLFIGLGANGHVYNGGLIKAQRFPSRAEAQKWQDYFRVTNGAGVEPVPVALTEAKRATLAETLDILAVFNEALKAVTVVAGR